MNVANLLNDIERLDLDRELPIWLANRTVDGQRTEDVQIVTVGGISVDEESQELIFLSAGCVEEDEIRGITTVNEFCKWATESQGLFANFLLYGAQKQIELLDSGFARSYNSLEAWFLPNRREALWLLFAPLDQWPSQ